MSSIKIWFRACSVILAMVAVTAVIPRNAVGQATATEEKPKSDLGDKKSSSTDQGSAGQNSAARDGAAKKVKQKEAKSDPASIASMIVRGSLSEAPAAPGLFGTIGGGMPKLLDRLKNAAADDDVPAIVLKIRSPSIGPGKLGELRQAIRQSRLAGKTIYAQMESGTASDFLLACACDKIIMPESGMLVLPGIRAEVMFYKGLFDKFDIKVDMLQVGDFKGAAEPYSRESMSDAFRKQYELVLDDLYDHLVDTIANERNLSREQVDTIIDTGLFTAAKAKEAGLIDLVGYSDELASIVKADLSVDKVAMVENYRQKKTDTDFSGMMGMIKMMEMLTGSGSARRKNSRPKVAIIHAGGVITSGKNQVTMFGGQSMGSDTIVAAIRQAEAEKTVKAIVLRVDSPGGSALASDLIWRAIQQAEKPIVASMGDMAASGGYYISMGCDHIFAQPRTLTGSIGVVGGKLAIGDAMRNFGLQTEVISRGKNSGIFSSTEAFSESEKQVFLSMMKETYEQFVGKAAEGRGLSRARMDDLAGGRIWTGRQAQANGLVDSLGTLEDAIDKARALAGVAAGEKLERLVLPEPPNIFEQLLGGAAMEMSAGSLPSQIRTPAAELELWQTLFADRVLCWLPYRVRIE